MPRIITGPNTPWCSGPVNLFSPVRDWVHFSVDVDTMTKTGTTAADAKIFLSFFLRV
jgi:hypothetical protein